MEVFAPFFTLLIAFAGPGVVLPLAFVLWLVFGRWRRRPEFRKLVIWLLGISLPWVFLSYWSALTERDVNTPSHSPWAGPIVIGVLIATVALAVAAWVRNPKAQLEFTVWGVVNTWIALMAALMYGMATTGGWL